MTEQQHGPPSPRAAVEEYQRDVDFVRQFFRRYDYILDNTRFQTVLALAQERVAELARRAEAAEQDEIAWRGGP